MKTIGERIKERRLQLNMSQEELAFKLGYKSRSSINKIEKDGRELRQNKIVSIAQALETTPAYIMGWTEEEEQPRTTTAPTGSELNLLKKYRMLNEEGQEKVDEYVDDLCSSGKYIKNCTDPMGKEETA